MGSGEIRTEVCVVGAGPAGITLARTLDAHGVKVCILESGGREVEPRLQRPSRGESDGYPIHLLHHSRIRAVGGTLRHPNINGEGWAARRLDAVDFDPRSDVPSSGWPFGKEHLEGYYARAEALCGLPTSEDAIGEWTADAGDAARSLATGDLEPAVFQFPTTTFTQEWDALGSSSRVRTMLTTRAVDFTTSANGERVEQVLAVRDSGERVVVHARAVVLATGGIENARLLLAANSGRGMGNEHDLVGRHFAERLSFFGGHLTLMPSTTLADLAPFHQEPGSAIGGGLRLSDKTQREHSLRNCIFYLVPRPAAVTTNAVRSLSTLGKARSRRPMPSKLEHHLRNVLLGGPAFIELSRRRFRDLAITYVLRVQGEPTPDRDSRVRLSDRRDRLGMPMACVHWKVSDTDLSSIRASARLVDRALAQRNLARLEWTADPGGFTLIEGNHHHLGTTRMHRDPRQGVVDADCRVHSMQNLYVAGASVLPGYGASNPTLTIVAMALRLADHLAHSIHAE